MAGDLTNALARGFEQNASKVRNVFETICEKYDRKFHDDIFDLCSGRIVRNRGVVKNLKSRKIGSARLGQHCHSLRRSPGDTSYSSVTSSPSELGTQIKTEPLDASDTSLFFSANCSRWAIEIGSESDPSDAETISSESSDEEDDAWQDDDDDEDDVSAPGTLDNRVEPLDSQGDNSNSSDWLALKQQTSHRCSQKSPRRKKASKNHVTVKKEPISPQNQPSHHQSLNSSGRRRAKMLDAVNNSHSGQQYRLQTPKFSETVVQCGVHRPQSTVHSELRSPCSAQLQRPGPHLGNEPKNPGSTSVQRSRSHLGNVPVNGTPRRIKPTQLFSSSLQYNSHFTASSNPKQISPNKRHRHGRSSASRALPKQTSPSKHPSHGITAENMTNPPDCVSVLSQRNGSFERQRSPLNQTHRKPSASSEFVSMKEGSPTKLAKINNPDVNLKTDVHQFSSPNNSVCRGQASPRKHSQYICSHGNRWNTCPQDINAGGSLTRNPYHVQLDSQLSSPTREGLAGQTTPCEQMKNISANDKLQQSCPELTRLLNRPPLAMTRNEEKLHKSPSAKSDSKANADDHDQRRKLSPAARLLGKTFTVSQTGSPKSDVFKFGRVPLSSGSSKKKTKAKSPDSRPVCEEDGTPKLVQQPSFSHAFVNQRLNDSSQLTQSSVIKSVQGSSTPLSAQKEKKEDGRESYPSKHDLQNSFSELQKKFESLAKDLFPSDDVKRMEMKGVTMRASFATRGVEAHEPLRNAGAHEPPHLLQTDAKIHRSPCPTAPKCEPSSPFLSPAGKEAFSQFPASPQNSMSSPFGSPLPLIKIESPLHLSEARRKFRPAFLPITSEEVRKMLSSKSTDAEGFVEFLKQKNRGVVDVSPMASPKREPCTLSPVRPHPRDVDAIHYTPPLSKLVDAQNAIQEKLQKDDGGNIQTPSTTDSCVPVISHGLLTPAVSDDVKIDSSQFTHLTHSPQLPNSCQSSRTSGVSTEGSVKLSGGIVQQFSKLKQASSQKQRNSEQIISSPTLAVRPTLGQESFAHKKTDAQHRSGAKRHVFSQMPKRDGASALGVHCTRFITDRNCSADNASSSQADAVPDASKSSDESSDVGSYFTGKSWSLRRQEQLLASKNRESGAPRPLVLLSDINSASGRTRTNSVLNHTPRTNAISNHEESCDAWPSPQNLRCFSKSSKEKLKNISAMVRKTPAHVTAFIEERVSPVFQNDGHVFHSSLPNEKETEPVGLTEQSLALCEQCGHMTTEKCCTSQTDSRAAEMRNSVTSAKKSTSVKQCFTHIKSASGQSKPASTPTKLMSHLHLRDVSTSNLSPNCTALSRLHLDESASKDNHDLNKTFTLRSPGRTVHPGFVSEESSESDFERESGGRCHSTKIGPLNPSALSTYSSGGHSRAKWVKRKQNETPVTSVERISVTKSLTTEFLGVKGRDLSLDHSVNTESKNSVVKLSHTEMNISSLVCIENDGHSSNPTVPSVHTVRPSDLPGMRKTEYAMSKPITHQGTKFVRISSPRGGSNQPSISYNSPIKNLSHTESSFFASSNKRSLEHDSPDTTSGAYKRRRIHAIHDTSTPVKMARPYHFTSLDDTLSTIAGVENNSTANETIQTNDHDFLSDEDSNDVTLIE